MKARFFALFLVLGSPWAFAEAAPSLDEDAVVESARNSRRPAAPERRTSRVLPPSPAVVTPKPTEIPVLLRPAPQVDPALLFPRPPPAR